MIVLKLKKIVCIIIFLIISIIGIVNVKKTVNVSATPIVNKIIILDAGHGLPDEGAVAQDGTSEEKINLEIVFKIQELLEVSGCKVVLTRSDENGIYEIDKESIKNKKISDMKKRVEIGNNSDGNIFVSIHLNKFSDKRYSGFQSFYKKNNVESEKLANCIQNNLKEFIENKREALSISKKYIMDNVKIPSVIVECGFLSNEEELEKLKTDEYQRKIAWGIYTGIMEFFEETE